MTLSHEHGGQNLTADIQEVNLSYLVLAQRMLRENYDDAVFRLNVTPESAQVLVSLSLSQLVTLASSPSLVCGFRLDDASLLSLLTQGTVRSALNQARCTLALAQGKTQMSAIKPLATTV